jgi:hypothetical protein
MEGEECVALPPAQQPPVLKYTFFAKIPKGGGGGGGGFAYQKDASEETSKPYWVELFHRGDEILVRQQQKRKRKRKRIDLKQVATMLVVEETKAGRQFVRREYDPSSPNKHKETPLDFLDAVTSLQDKIKKRRFNKKKVGGLDDPGLDDPGLDDPGLDDPGSKPPPDYSSSNTSSASLVVNAFHLEAPYFII